MHKKSINRPISGLDQDSEDRLISPEDYRYLLNGGNTVQLAGTLTNIKGNLPITTYYYPYNGNVVPSGENVAIGSVEDTQENSVVWFIWNSTGKHHILRHYRDMTNTDNPYGVVHQVIQYDFGWTRETRITSASIVYGNVGDLLYWTDNVKPREINLTKANVVDKKKSWNLYFPVTCDLANTFTFTFKDFSGATIRTLIVGLSDPTNREQIIADITAYINGLNNVPVIAESCDCKLTFTEKVSGTVWDITSDCPQLLIPARLEGDGFWYGPALEERFFDRAKYQFLTPNTMTFAQDSDYEPNYVQRKVFQSRLQALYDDDSGTDLALGVWSQIPINNLRCDGSSNPLYNYIDINFNGQDIADRKTLVVLKKIRLIMRERNDGSNRSIIDLDPCDFLDYDYVDNKWVVHYNFYNDIIPSSVDPALAAKLFDNVPLKADSELFTKNRMVEGGILEGYDAPDCINAKAQMEFGEGLNRKLIKIRGRIKIHSWGMFPIGKATQRSFYQTFDNTYFQKYPFWKAPDERINQGIRRGGIFSDVINEGTPFYGGGNFKQEVQSSFAMTGQMTTLYDQRIPEGGWPVYAAGTNYLTISKQVNTISLPIDSVGALDISNATKVEDIGNAMWYDRNDPNYTIPELYSEFELLVPENQLYTIRLASHWCSIGDKLEKGFMYDIGGGTSYQKTSTNVWCIIDSNGNAIDNKEITVNVGSSDMYIGDFVVMDLAPIGTENNSQWRPLNLYVVSDEADNSDINSDTFTGLPIEKSLVAFGSTGIDNNFYAVGSNSYVAYDVGWQNTCFTDHNGYCFGIGGYNDGTFTGPLDPPPAIKYFPITIYEADISQPNNITKVRDSDTIIYVGNYSMYYDKTLNPTDYKQIDITGGNGTTDDVGQLIHGFVATTKVNTRETCLTFVEGNIVQNGKGIDGVTVVYQDGAVTVSGNEGFFSVRAWADIITPNLPIVSQAQTFIPVSGRDRVVDGIIITGSIFCGITYPNGQYLQVTITPYGPNVTTQYNPIRRYNVGDFEVIKQNQPSIKALKRGGNYIYGLRLYDDAGRLCSVAKAFEMYVPFITEDIGKYQIEDFAGAIYPANTFKYGKPSIKWVLDPTTIFPTWATTFQWMRVKNSIYGRYLQWVANQVTYLSAVATSSTPEIETSFQNSDAVAIKISISNIVNYYAQNNDSQVGYSYEPGDRIRLIENRYLENYNGLNDFEVTSYETDSQSIIVKAGQINTELQSGMLFEVFNQKSVADADEQIFYEVGETFNIVNGIPEKYSDVFTNGDTYWRGRFITVNDDATKFAASYPVVIEDSSISDNYKSDDQDIGRVGIIDPNFKQLYNPSKIRFSNQYSIETAKNGLSSFEELNQKDLPREYGTIKRMMFTNNNLVCVMENKEVSNYIGLVTLMQASKGAESGLVSVTDSFLGTEYIHKQMLGTDYAGSVTLSNEGVIFAYNNRSANAWKYTQEESVISDVKMINYFNKLSVDGISDAVSIFDRYKEEYVLTVWRKYQNKSTVVSVIKFSNTEYKLGVSYPDGAVLPEIGSRVEFQFYLNGQWNTTTGVVNSIVAVTGGSVVSIVIETTTVYSIGMVVNVICSIPETIAWNESKQKWSSFYSFTPNCYGVLRTEIYSWKDGKIWIHNKNEIRNNFYGEQFTTKLNVVVNQEPDETKNFYALYLESEQDAGFDWSIPVVKNTNQLSRVLKNIFEKREQFWFAEFKRDLNTSGVTNPIVNGRQLRSSALELQMENDYEGQIVLRNIVCAYLNSARQ